MLETAVLHCMSWIYGMESSIMGKVILSGLSPALPGQLTCWIFSNLGFVLT